VKKLLAHSLSCQAYLYKPSTYAVNVLSVKNITIIERQVLVEQW